MGSISSPHPSKISDIKIRAVREQDLPEVDHIIRVAFGTFLGSPDPARYMGDTDYARTRWLTDPSAVFGAELNGELVGSNFATRWGSVGFFGPLTIRPDLWDRGIAQALLAPTMDLFDHWGIRHAGLFTFASSTKHVNLYQKFGFWPRFLTALMAVPVSAKHKSEEWASFSELSSDEKLSCVQACRELTSSIYEGLDVEREIRAVDDQHLGDTILIWNGSRLAGFAVCHAGPGTEAGTGKCYVKFGVVKSGPDASREFQRLLGVCHDFAAVRDATEIEAGVNLARLDAYREMLQAGFRSARQGVVMERNGEAGYNRREVFLIDDWR